MTDISVVLFQRDKWWIAQCLQYDIGAQAHTVPDVMYELQRSIVGHMAIAKQLGKEPLTDFPAAPRFYWEKFQGTTLRVESSDIPIRALSPQVTPRAEFRIAA